MIPPLRFIIRHHQSGLQQHRSKMRNLARECIVVYEMATWSDYNGLVIDSYFKNTTTHTNTSQAKVTFEFWGSSIQIIGAKSPNHGNFQVQLDGQVFESLTGHSDPPASYQQQLFAQSGLSSGKHEVVITNTQDGMFLDIDLVCVHCLSRGKFRFMYCFWNRWHGAPFWMRKVAMLYSIRFRMIVLRSCILVHGLPTQVNLVPLLVE